MPTDLRSRHLKVMKMHKSSSSRVSKSRKLVKPSHSSRWCKAVLEAVGYWQRPQNLFSHIELPQPSLKRAAPSSFNLNVNQRPSKRPCNLSYNPLSRKRALPVAFDYDIKQRPFKKPCYGLRPAPILQKPSEAERYFVSCPPVVNVFSKSLSSTSSSQDTEDEDDVWSQCSTATDFTALSWDDERSDLKEVNKISLQIASRDYAATHTSHINLHYYDNWKNIQARATSIDLSLPTYDRSFSLHESKEVVDEDIQDQEPSWRYSNFPSADESHLWIALNALYLKDITDQNTLPHLVITPSLPPVSQASVKTAQQHPQIDTQTPMDLSTPLSERNKASHAVPSNTLKIKSDAITQISPPIQSIPKAPKPLEKPAYQVKQVLGKRKTQHEDLFGTIRENINLVPDAFHKSVEKILFQCEGRNLSSKPFPSSLEDRPRFENLADAMCDKDSHAFNFVGQPFYFQELVGPTISKWYRSLYNRATKQDGEAFFGILRSFFMAGLHPKDCFPRDSEWIEYFFGDNEMYLNNRRIDDIYAWRYLECNYLDEPEFSAPPYDEDVEYIEAFREGASLDILQKVVVDWLDAGGDKELGKERADLFEEAMDAAHLCDNSSNQFRDGLFKWLDGCIRMGSGVVGETPEQVTARDALEKALLKLFEYRYPRSWNLGVNEDLLEARNDQEVDDDDEVDNQVPGRG